MRILLVGVDWVGDVLLSTPAVRALKQKFPDAFIAYSTARRAVPLLRENPNVNAVIPFDEKPFLLNIPENLRFWSDVRRGGFDRAYFLHGSLTRAFLCAAAGIASRIGSQRKKKNVFLTHTVAPQFAGTRHRAADYGAVLSQDGVVVDDLKMDYRVTPAEREAWNEKKKTLLGDAKRYAVLHSGGNWGLKRWPVERFEETALYLAGMRDMKVFLCGTAGENALAERIAHASQSGAIVNLCGKTDLRELGAILEGASLMVSNDSGPIHMAAALGTPLIGIFGPTSPQVTAPYSRGPMRILHHDVGCVIPCYFRACHHHACMAAVTTPEVVGAIDALLS